MKTKYTVKAFWSQDEPSNYPSGYDVWEETEKSAVVVASCDTEEEANREAQRLNEQVS